MKAIVFVYMDSRVIVGFVFLNCKCVKRRFDINPETHGGNLLFSPTSSRNPVTAEKARMIDDLSQRKISFCSETHLLKPSHLSQRRK